MFCRYSLRTTDAEAARRFYAEALGLELPDGVAPGSALEAWPLHARARAMGAPPHWLGQIAVDDAEATAERLVALGADRLGPSVRLDGEVRYATVRDPFGAVLAVRQGSAPPSPAPVAWHQLHVTDAERAVSVYGELFGWARCGTLAVPGASQQGGAGIPLPDGGYHLLAFREGDEPACFVANTARWPGVHAQWLFYFPVSDLDAAVARVRALGGNAFDPLALPGQGPRLSACEDPQGAAFGLVSRTGVLRGSR